MRVREDRDRCGMTRNAMIENIDHISAIEHDHVLVNSSFVARRRKVSLICLINGHREFPARIRDQMRRTAFPSCDGLTCLTFRPSRPISHGSRDSKDSATRARTQLMI